MCVLHLDATRLNRSHVLIVGAGFSGLYQLGLNGGAGWIRTPATARFSMDGVGRGFGALIGPTKSILAGENLFAWDSAAKLAFVRSLSARTVRG
jgi:hypothetical protein